MTERPYGYRAAVLVLESLVVILIAATGYWNVASLRAHDQHVQQWLTARTNSDAVQHAVVAVEDERQAAAGNDRGMFLQHARQCTDALHQVKLPSGTREAALLDQILSEHRRVEARGDRLLLSPSTAQPAVGRFDQEVRNLLQTLQDLERQLPAAPERMVRHHSLMRSTAITVALVSVVTLSLLASVFVLLNRLSRMWATNQAMAAAERVRADFVSFISHELRNSMYVLQAGVAFLRDEGLQLDLRQQMSDAIGKSVGGLSRLVVNLLTADRVGRGRLEPSLQRVSAASAVTDTIERITSYREGLRQRLQVTAPPADAVVMADPDYLDLVLSNLLDNALKFSPDGAPIRVDVSTRNRDVVFSVTDHGIGIPESKMGSIFEPYETSGQDSGHRSGTGVGLYLCRRLVQAQGGHIEVTSALGSGSTFTVVLPAAGAPEGQN